MKLVYLLSLFIPFNLIADCQVSNGRSMSAIPESSKISLFEKGKSLSTHYVQDQDGLGTCYANATSAILKSVLPGKPDLSYLHAAVSASTRGWEADRNAKMKYIKKEDGEEADFTSGGYVCSTIAGLKKAGGACPKLHSLLESSQGINPDLQSQFLVGLGKYFDSFNDSKNDPKKNAQIKQDLALSVEFIKSEASSLRKTCEDRKNQRFPVERALKRLLTPALSLYREEKNPCNEARLKRLEAYLSPRTVLKKDRVFIEPDDQLKTKFLGLVSDSPEATGLIEKFINAKDYDNDLLDKIGKEIGQSFDQLTSSVSGSDDESVKCEENAKNSLLLGGEPEVLAKNFVIDMRDDKQADCTAEFAQEDSRFLLLTANESQSCIAPTRFEEILDAVIPLARIGALLDGKLKNNLENPHSVFANQITNAIMPGCLLKKNLINLEKVSCASFPMCDPAIDGEADMANSTYSGPKKSCYGHPQAEALVRMKAISSINNGRAMGVAVCTAFMDDPKARTDFCRKPLPGVEGHSYHEMTISGYRCVAGKIEYEILNSWGNSCPAENGKKNEALECDQNEFGLPNGRFWVKEEVIVDSMVDITSVRVKK